MTTKIPWDDGTGDQITLTYSGTSGVQTVLITSDEHQDFSDRQKDITFKVVAGGTTIERTLTVKQSGRDLIIVTDNDVATSDNDVVGGDLAND